MKISVIGCGGWGLAVSSLLEGNGHDVSVWCFLEEEYKLLSETRGNEKLLPGVHLNENIKFTMDMSCAEGCGIVVVAVPSFAVYSTALQLRLKNLFRNQFRHTGNILMTREFICKKKRLPWILGQNTSNNPFRFSVMIRIRCIKIVHTIFHCIIYHFFYLRLINLTFCIQWKTHGSKP